MMSQKNKKVSRLTGKLVLEALRQLHRRSGSTFSEIQEYILENFAIDTNFLNLRVRHVVDYLLESNEIIEMQCSRKFKLNPRKKVHYSGDHSDEFYERRFNRHNKDRMSTGVDENARPSKRKEMTTTSCDAKKPHADPVRKKTKTSNESTMKKGEKEKKKTSNERKKKGEKEQKKSSSERKMKGKKELKKTTNESQKKSGKKKSK